MAYPKPKVWWPLTITTANQAFTYRQSSTDYSGTIAAGTYYSAAELLSTLLFGMNLVAGHAGTFTGSVSALGYLTLTNSTTAFILRWSSFPTNSCAGLLGWTATNTSSATSQVAPYPLANGWWSPLPPRQDLLTRYEQPDAVVTVAVGGQAKAIYETEQSYRDVSFAFLSEEYALTHGQTSYNVRRAIENWWRSARGRFRYWPDATVEATYGDYALDGDSVEDGFAIKRMLLRKAIYETGLIRMRTYVA